MMNKYRTAPPALRTYNGILFDSKAEMNRYLDLLAMERAGIIRKLERQVEFVLVPGFKHQRFGTMRALSYRADFRYEEISSGRTIVEDVKGAITKVYRIKRMLLLSQYPGIDFVEVPA
jgi:hypothetical protein